MLSGTSPSMKERISRPLPSIPRKRGAPANPTRCRGLLVELTTHCVGESEDAGAKETKRCENTQNAFSRRGRYRKAGAKRLVRDKPHNIFGEPQTSPTPAAVKSMAALSRDGHR